MIPVNTDADMLSVLKRLGKEKKMPLYEYICTECEHKQEVMRLVRELNKVQFCDKCGGQMNLIPAVPSRMIRGSGGWSSPA